MHKETTLVTVATVEKTGTRRTLRISSEYRDAVAELGKFSHLIAIWWADRYEEYRFAVDHVIELPYAPGHHAGLFATRSPVRPNPICLNTCRILEVDPEAGTITVDEIDAFDGTAILDIKPYYGCIDRVEEYAQPDWVPAEWGNWYAPIPEE